jgi:hypothetical protein
MYYNTGTNIGMMNQQQMFEPKMKSSKSNKRFMDLYADAISR